MLVCAFYMYEECGIAEEGFMGGIKVDLRCCILREETSKEG